MAQRKNAEVFLLFRVVERMNDLDTIHTLRDETF